VESATVYRYSAYQLTIASPVQLPDLPTAADGDDVRIQLQRSDPHAGPPPGMAAAFHVTPRFATLAYAGLGTLTVRNGCELAVTPLPDADEAQLPTALTGAALAVLLYQRGLLVLQASAMAIDGVAAVFLAGGGSGKSTLAAKLHQRGHTLVAEDITAIELRAGPPAVIPAAPLLRLDGATSLRLGIEARADPSQGAATRKGVRLVEHGFARAQAPLGVIYHLHIGGDNNIAHVPLQTGLAAVLYHSYPACLLQPGGIEHLQRCSRLVGAVPVCELIRRDDLCELPELVQMIESHMAAGPLVNSRDRA
jgi:hypothetical protein